MARKRVNPKLDVREMGEKHTLRFWSSAQRLLSGCWVWRGPKNNHGYGRFSLTPRLYEQAHRVAYELVHGEIPLGMLVRHTCDNRMCVSPDHLKLGTPADNSSDMVRRGRSMAGSMNPKSALFDCDVIAIRDLSRDGLSNAEIARRYHVSPNTIGRLLSGKTYAAVGR